MGSGDEVGAGVILGTVFEPRKYDARSKKQRAGSGKRPELISHDLLYSLLFGLEAGFDLVHDHEAMPIVTPVLESQGWESCRWQRNMRRCSS